MAIVSSVRHAIAYRQRQGRGSISTASFVALMMAAAASQTSDTASKGAVLPLSRELGVQFAREDLVHILMGRFAEPEVLAGSVAFPASADDSSFIMASTFIDNVRAQAPAHELTEDEQRLHELGYKHELRRCMSAFSNFAVSCDSAHRRSGRRQGRHYELTRPGDIRHPQRMCVPQRQCAAQQPSPANIIWRNIWRRPLPARRKRRPGNDISIGRSACPGSP